MLRRFAQGSLVIVVALAGASAHAGDPARPTASAATASDPAQALFDGGVADMEAGLFEKACPAIEASQRLDPRPGTLFTLAECEARRGRAATAMRYYAEYLGLHRNFTAAKKLEQKDRAKTSEEQLRKLELLVPRLTIVLLEGTGPDVVVRRDGEVVAELSLGTALPVDPGEHVVTAQAPGGPEIEQRVSLSPGEAKTVRLAVRREVGPVATATVTASASAAPSGTPFSEVQRPWRISTWTIGAVGLGGLVVGAVTGILAAQLRPTVDRNCPAQDGVQTCNPLGYDALERLRALGTASTVSLIAGGVGVGVGVVLLLATPSVPTSTTTVGSPRTSAFVGEGMVVHVGGHF
jgi:hypothetical protein